MCGILGLIQKDKLINKELFQEMLNTLHKRGPDQEGIFISGNLALGHRRLSIIDLSIAGKQPMFNENKNVVIVFNGEIYNYHEVKYSLSQKHIWNSKTDTEVLIHGYEEYGQKLVEKIEGMFAYSIYDKRENILTLARDHFGKKPLYYYIDDNVFCFSSEIKAILKNLSIKSKLTINKKSLTKYLYYGYVPSPNSIFNQIQKLEPSTTFQFDIKNWRIINKNQYWKLGNIKQNNLLKKNEILERTHFLIDESVKKRLMSDVPLGIFLSGGVDSSLITAYLSKYSPNVQSFSVCYKNSSEADESVYAKRAAKSFDINYNLCYFEDSLVKENFIEILDYLDEPMADAAIIPLYYIAKFAKDKITVVLSGDGGDEVFGGYAKYKIQLYLERIKYLSFLLSVFKPFIIKNSSYYKLLHSATFPFYARQFIFGSGSLLNFEVANLLNYKPEDITEVFSESESILNEFCQKDIINASLFLDCKIQLPDWYLVKGDRATMAASLEMRNPLLDKNLSEFAFSINGNWKIHRGEQKYILKKLLERSIDHDIIYRSKRGFGVPLDKWIRNELKDLFDEVLFFRNDFFNQNYIRKIYNEHLSAKANHEFKLLRIFNFNYWLMSYYV